MPRWYTFFHILIGLKIFSTRICNKAVRFTYESVISGIALLRLAHNDELPQGKR